MSRHSMPTHTTVMRGTPIRSMHIHDTCWHSTAITDTCTHNINMLPGDTPAAGMLHDMSLHDVSHVCVARPCTACPYTTYPCMTFACTTCACVTHLCTTQVCIIQLCIRVHAHARVFKICWVTQHHSVTDAEYMLHNEHCSPLHAHM